MKDSTLLLGQAESLRTQYQKDGYLLIRDLIDKTSILDARQKILDRLFSLKRVQSYDDPRPINGTHGVALFTDLDLHQSKEVKKALESTALFDFFRVFFGEAAATYTYKWLRAVGVGEFTGAHLDKVSYSCLLMIQNLQQRVSWCWSTGLYGPRQPGAYDCLDSIGENVRRDGKCACMPLHSQCQSIRTIESNVWQIRRGPRCSQRSGCQRAFDG